MVSWTHPEKAVSRLNSDALVTQLPSSSPVLYRVKSLSARDVNILKDRQSGMKCKDVAKKYNISTSTVGKIAKTFCDKVHNGCCMEFLRYRQMDNC